MKNLYLAFFLVSLLMSCDKDLAPKAIVPQKPLIANILLDSIAYNQYVLPEDFDFQSRGFYFKVFSGEDTLILREMYNMMIPDRQHFQIRSKNVYCDCYHEQKSTFKGLNKAYVLNERKRHFTYYSNCDIIILAEEMHGKEFFVVLPNE